jgi:hypothetical protein
MDLAEGVPLLLTSSSSGGYLAKEFDDHTPVDPDPTKGRLYTAERAARFDQELELAAPFRIGEVGIRPFLSGRYTAYSDSPSGSSIDRFTLAGGVRAGTRLERVFELDSDLLNLHQVRHSVHPEVEYVDVYQVSEPPAAVWQFDRSDALGTVDGLMERRTIRLVLLNRFQTKRATDRLQPDRLQIVDFLWIDLAQTVFPTDDRDNLSRRLGLFEFEVIYRPDLDLLPLADLGFLVEGEWDWRLGTLRTFNLAMAFSPFTDATAALEWRKGHDGEGTLDGRIRTYLRGRWEAGVGMQYDLELSQVRDYRLELGRRDHDWTTRVVIAFDRIDDELTVSVNFEPRIGGLYRPHRDRYLGGDRQFGTIDRPF